MRYRTLLLGFLLGSASILAQPPQPTQTFKGHADPIYTLSLSPDGKLLATGSFDKSIRLWDAKTAKEIRLLAGKQGHQNQVLQVAFSPKGDMLASGSSDNTAKLWDIATGSPANTLKHDAAILKLTLTPDGKSVAALGQNGTIKTWTIADGKAGPTLASPTAQGFAFTSNAAQLLTIGADRNLRQLAYPAGTVSGSVGTGVDVQAFAVNPTNNQSLLAGDGVLNVFPATLIAPRAISPAPANVTQFVLSADGQFLFSAQADKSARVVNFANGQQTQLFSGLAAEVKSLAIPPNNQGYAIGTADGKAILFSADGKPRATIATGDKSVDAILYHPNQQQLLTAGPDGTVKVWAIPQAPPKSGSPEPKPIATIKVNSPVLQMGFLPNGQLLTSTADKTLKTWDIASGKQLKAYPALPNLVKAWSISKDGNAVALSLGKTVKILTLADGKETTLPDQPAEVGSLSFNSDKTKLVLGCSDNTARVVELASGKALQFASASGPITGVAFHPTQPTFAVSTTDKSISVQTLQTVKQIVDPSIGKLLVMSATGSHFFTAGNGRGLAIWNASSFSKERTIDLESPFTAFAQSKNGQLLAVATANSTITLLNYADGTLIGSFKAAAKVTGLAFHPTAQVLFASQENNSVQSWGIPYDAGQPIPAEFGKPLQEFAHPATLTSFVVTPDGLNVLTSSVDQLVRVWKMVSDAPSKSLQHPNLVDAVAFDPTGALLATGCHDGVLRVFDVAKGVATKTINAHTTPQAQPIYSVIWSADGKQLITASFDKSIKFWDVEKATLIREIRPGYDRFPPDPQLTKYTPAIIGALGSAWLNAPPDQGHRDQVFTLALSPDGKYLASGSSDRTIKLWNPATGLLVRDFPNPTFKAPPAGLQAQSHPGFVHQVRFTKDGAKLISVGTAPRGQGYLASWSVADGKLLGGYELPIGPIYSFDIAPNSVILGCGSKQRFVSESEAVTIPLPVK
jgi:WD40 repeat protein